MQSDLVSHNVISISGDGSGVRCMQLFDGASAPIRNSSAAADGTVLISETFSRSRSTTKAKAFSARITRPPRESGTKISKIDRSKHTDIDASTSANSASLKACSAQRNNATPPTRASRG